MKAPFLKPGFEFVFSLSLIAILGLPPMLLAQAQKDVEIKIENGDTTVNGKNIKELSPKERKNALMDINHITGDDNNHKDEVHVFTFRRSDSLDGKTERFNMRIKKMKRGEHPPFITEDDRLRRDSLGDIIERRSVVRRPMELRERNEDERPGGPMMRFNRRNSQNFNYVSIDNEGISTHVSYHVSEASNEDLKRMPHVEGAKFDINDLNIVPEFTSGKTLLMFNLPAKTAAEVKFHDSEGKLLWSEKIMGGSFSKTFALGLNGIYYLQVKQGNNVVAKRIVKEE
jgi:hypothetical protein